MSRGGIWPYRLAAFLRERGGEAFSAIELADRYGIRRDSMASMLRGWRARGLVARVRAGHRCPGGEWASVEARQASRALYVPILTPRSAHAGGARSPRSP